MAISVKQANVELGERHASLHLAHGANGPVLTARVPSTFREEDFAPVAKSAFGLIHKLTGCNCLSGRISFVVEDNFADVIRVNLGPAREVGV
jgi:hypothetical protein